MAGRKLELASRIAIEHNLPVPVAGKILQAFLDSFIDSLATEGRIELREFGTFRVRECKPQRSRNPRTGEFFTLPVRRRVTFKMGRTMRQRVRGK